jgi:hypothetical protein
MPVNEGHSIASPVVKKGTTPKTILEGKEKEGQGPKLTSSTSTPKKKPSTKEAKPKEAG